MADFGTITVANTATQILPANNDRKSFHVFNVGAGTVYLGQDSSVAKETGFPIPQNAVFVSAGQNAVWKGVVYGIVDSATSDVRFWEY